MYTIGIIDKKMFEKYYGTLHSDEVIITDERITHIKEHHPQDYALFQLHGKECLISPDLIITDKRNFGTVYMIKKMKNENPNMVLKLSLKTERNNLKNSIITFWRIRDKNVNKLIKKNRTLYKKE